MVLTHEGKAIWNLDLLAPATTQLLVVTDTHFILPDNAQSSEWNAVREFPTRTTRALQLAAGLPRDAAIHLGDISHEYPETGRAEIAQQGALDQFSSLGLAFLQAAGNMDIGDKPDPTSPAQWVTPETLNGWHQQCGRSWHGFDVGPFHGVVLNTQIMNGPLPEAEEQRVWLERELESHAGKRLLFFLHMPIFYVDRHEQSFGFYNSLDEPARSWLLGLIEQYGVEYVFTGHTHTVQVNRHGNARLWTCPSTATSRAGLAEAYAVVGPDRGRGDIDKLGFFLVRDTDHGMSVHLVRTGRGTPALDRFDPRSLVMTRTSRDLPNGRIGINLTHPLGHANPGPVIWPSIVRQPVRDDFRLMSVLESGCRFLRVPASDLRTAGESERLTLLREESVHIEPYWLWSERVDLVAETAPFAGDVDLVEVVLPGATLPAEPLISQIRTLRDRGMEVKLTTALVDDGSSGQYHQRTRIGYGADELSALDKALQRHDITVDHIACRLDLSRPLLQQITGVKTGALASIGAVDWYIDFVSLDDAENARLIAEAAVLVAAQSGARLVVGPHVDFDRSMDETHGLIDRLSNPSRAYIVLKMLNSLLFGTSDVLSALSGDPIGVQADGWSLVLVAGLADGTAPFARSVDDDFADANVVTVFDLAAQLSRVAGSQQELVDALNKLQGPGAIVRRQT